MIATTTEEFKPEDACVAWLSIDLGLLPRTLDVLLDAGKIKRHRLGGTIVFCQALKMAQRADILAYYLVKLDVSEASAAS